MKKQTEVSDLQWEGSQGFQLTLPGMIQEFLLIEMETTKWGEKKRHQAERAALLPVLQPDNKMSPAVVLWCPWAWVCALALSSCLSSRQIVPGCPQKMGSRMSPLSISLTGIPNLRPLSCAKGLKRGWFGLGKCTKSRNPNTENPCKALFPYSSRINQSFPPHKEG